MTGRGDLARILTVEEIRRVLADLDLRLLRSDTLWVRRQLIIFRLPVFCGLRASEACSLQLGDVCIDRSAPVLSLRQGATKGGDPRSVPLYLDATTYHDIVMWRKVRLGHGATDTDPFLCNLYGNLFGTPMRRNPFRIAFQRCLKCLGERRAKEVHAHMGRHTCISHWRAAGYGTIQVRDWAGHKDSRTTDRYMHVITDVPGNPENFPNLLDYAKKRLE